MGAARLVRSFLTVTITKLWTGSVPPAERVVTQGVVGGGPAATPDSLRGGYDAASGSGAPYTAGSGKVPRGAFFPSRLLHRRGRPCPGRSFPQWSEQLVFGSSA